MRDHPLGGWHSPTESIPFRDLPVGALFTTSMFYCDASRLKQKVDEDRWARFNDQRGVVYGFEGRSSTWPLYQCEWIPMPRVPSDTGPEFMHKLLDATGVPVVGCAT